MSSSGSSRLPEPLSAVVGSISWRRVLVDLAVVVAWVVAVSVVFRTTGWPVWAYYAAVFGGVIAYSLAGVSWARRRR